jgi:putative membrane protein
MHGWYDNDGGYGWLGGLFMALTMLVFWGGLITLILLLARHYLPRRHPGADERDTATRLLDERFARGDIDAEEYQQRRDLLAKR